MSGMTVEARFTMKKMTIRNAKVIYRTYGYRLFEDEVRMLLEQHGDSYGQKISNSNYLHALFLTDLMFNNTFQDLKIVTGQGGEGFLETLSKSFQNALGRIAQNNGKAKIIVAGEEKTPYLIEMEKKYSCLKLHYKQPTAPEKIEHFVVADSLMVREEQAHPIIEDELDAGVIKATVHINNLKKGRLVSLRFDKLWDFLGQTQTTN